MTPFQTDRLSENCPDANISKVLDIHSKRVARMMSSEASDLAPGNDENY